MSDSGHFVPASARESYQVLSVLGRTRSGCHISLSILDKLRPKNCSNQGVPGTSSSGFESLSATVYVYRKVGYRAVPAWRRLL